MLDLFSILALLLCVAAAPFLYYLSIRKITYKSRHID